MRVLAAASAVIVIARIHALVVYPNNRKLHRRTDQQELQSLRRRDPSSSSSLLTGKLGHDTATSDPMHQQSTNHSTQVQSLNPKLLLLTASCQQPEALNTPQRLWGRLRVNCESPGDGVRHRRNRTHQKLATCAEEGDKKKVQQ